MSSTSPQLVQTVCLNSSSATVEGDEYVFDLHFNAERSKAIKVMLASFEFPTVQYNVEDFCCCLYLNEGFAIREEDREIVVEETFDASPGKRRSVFLLPLFSNPVSSLSVSGSYLTVTTLFPHGLWSPSGRFLAPLFSKWGYGACLACTGAGAIPLPTSPSEAEEVDAYSFSFPVPLPVLTRLEAFNARPLLGLGEGIGILLTGRVPSPSLLAHLATSSLSGGTEGGVAFRYDAEKNEMRAEASTYPPLSSSYTLRLEGGGANLLGFGGGGTVSTRTFRRNRTSPETAGRGSEGQRLFLTSQMGENRDDVCPLSLPPVPFLRWGVARLDPGWYVPCHRPMACGSPLRLPSEFDASLNRLHFPLKQPTKPFPTGHTLVFADPSGTPRIVPLLSGSYTPSTFSASLSSRATSLIGKEIDGFSLEVDFDDEEGVFTLSSFVNDFPAPFSLLFDHSASTIDPSRLGFDQGCYAGRPSYTSTRGPLRFPSVTTPSGKEETRNVYRLSELTAQKKFRIGTEPHPPLVGVVREYEGGSLLLETYASGIPYVCGAGEGEVVFLDPLPSPVEVLSDGEGEGWVLTSVKNGEWKKCFATNVPFERGEIAIVKGDSSHTGHKNRGENKIRLLCGTDFSFVEGEAVGLRLEDLPFNLCFEVLPNSLKAAQLGFKKGATQWGKDGEMREGKIRLPPFLAPNVYYNDHPDYVLLFLSDREKVGTLLCHEKKYPFAKLVMFPMMREERMLPRDMLTLSGESMNRVRLRVENPTGEPYRFHGASFSLSLSFVFA